MSSKLFKLNTNKPVRRPLDPTTKQEEKPPSSKPHKAQLRNPGKARFSESLNNYNAVRENVEHELQRSTRSAPPEATVKKRVSVGPS